MKHCPNPDCYGLAESGLVSEYEDSATACADCGGPLVDGPAPASAPGEQPEPDVVLVPLARIDNLQRLTLLESQLEAAGIPYLAKGEHIQDLFGVGRLVAVNPITGPVELQVREDDLARAQAIVDELVE